MPAIGGSIESVTLDGRIFSVPADAEAQRNLGGFQNEVQPNGDGTARLIKTRAALLLEGVTVEIDDSRGDHEYLKALADRPDFFPVAVTYVSGVTYQGRAQIVGDFQASSQAATASISLAGPGELTKQ